MGVSCNLLRIAVATSICTQEDVNVILPCLVWLLCGIAMAPEKM